MKNRVVFITVILMLLIISCADNPVETVENEDAALSYKNEALGFKISVPKDWELEENIQIGEYEALVVGSKMEYTGTQPAFNIIHGNMPSELSASALLSSSEQNLPNMFPDMEFDSKKIIIVGGYECAEIVFHHNYNGIDLKQKQLLFMCQPTTLFVITFDSDLSEYDANQVDFDKIQASITKL